MESKESARLYAMYRLPEMRRWRARRAQLTGTRCHSSQVRWAVEEWLSVTCRVEDISLTACCQRSRTNTENPSGLSRSRSRRHDKLACTENAAAGRRRQLIRLLSGCSTFPRTPTSSPLHYPPFRCSSTLPLPFPQPFDTRNVVACEDFSNWADYNERRSYTVFPRDNGSRSSH